MVSFHTTFFAEATLDFSNLALICLHADALLCYIPVSTAVILPNLYTSSIFCYLVWNSKFHHLQPSCFDIDLHFDSKIYLLIDIVSSHPPPEV